MYSIVLVLILLIVDQISKYIVAKNLDVSQSIPIIKDFFHITYVQNRGIAFGMFQGRLNIVTIISLFAAIFIFYYIFKNREKLSKLSLYSYLFIFSGALGNILDRLMRQYVVDFIDFRGIWEYIFNFADVYINIGVILMVIEYILEEKKKRQEESK
ncbi:signal peptidase II [Hypnocyclicus thermotrophus]|uniref:Lipoprotein signal peptidase n=1 Tax=Hypnocyclicus thermotrophus TaxID=1627895 RepID=A0AA46DZ30_9FUSO|nr:signal peptidase II [Hypnocyclicus thermotrophus]TDT71389.1 signal peptidase II [Hypnocyclicus thermotrophus]